MNGIGKIIYSGLKIAGYTALGGAVAELGGAVAKKTGIVERGSELLLELTGQKPGPGALPQVAGVPTIAGVPQVAPLGGAPSPQLAGAPAAAPQLAPPAPIVRTARPSILPSSAARSTPVRRENVEPSPAPRIEVPSLSGADAAPVEPTVRVVCPDCESKGPVLAGMGESFELRRCSSHEEAALAGATHHEAMFLGWVDAWREQGVDPLELGVGGCGAKPALTKGSVYDRWNGWDTDRFNADLAKYQSCLQKETSARAKAKKAQHTKDAAHEKRAISKAQKWGAHVVRAQKSKYESQIQAMKDAQAAAATQAEKDALQKQINDLQQKAAASDQLALQLQTQAKDAASQAKIDELSREIANQAKQPAAPNQPSPMDQMVQMMMVKQMMAPGAPPPDPMVQLAMIRAMGPMAPPPGSLPAPMPDAPAPPPQAFPWGGGMPPQGMPPQGMPPQGMPQDGGVPPAIFIVNADDGSGGGADYLGVPADPEVLEQMGLSGLDGLSGEDALELQGFADSGAFSPAELREMAEYAAMENVARANSNGPAGVCLSGCSPLRNG